MARYVTLLVCLGVFAANAIYATQSALRIGHWSEQLPPFPLICGALASFSAIVLGLWLVLDHRGRGRPWAKAALALLMAAVAGWWTIQWPAMTDLLCIDSRCYDEAFEVTRSADIKQAQIGIAVATWAALVCALQSVVERTSDADADGQ